MSTDSRRRTLVRELLDSPEPSIRWRTRVRVLGEPESSRPVRRLTTEIRSSRTSRRLLTRLHAPFRPGSFGGVYRAYQGSHWALTSLADLGYPPADVELRAFVDRALAMWTRPQYDVTVRRRHRPTGLPARGVLRLKGRYRRCASQQGNALFYATRLGFADARADRLAELLVRWQWEDGGWNCSRAPNAHVSSFMETLAPLRGLAAHADRTGSPTARAAVRRAAEVFLTRRVFRRRTNGRVIRRQFLRLHYPLYWHYDVLGGLKGIAEADRLSDPRCREALDWLESRELSDGGWPADARFYTVSEAYRAGSEFVDWGAPSPRRRNDWVTTDALYVLQKAGRWAM